MSTLTIPNTAVAGQKILAADFNGNFTAVATWANGSIDDANLTNAGITASSKLKTGTVTKALMATDSVGSAQVEDDAILPEHVGYFGVIVMPLDYTGTGRVQGAVWHNITEHDVEILSAILVCSTPPTTSEEEVSVVIQPITYTDPDSGGTAVVFTTSDPDIQATNHKGDERVVASAGICEPNEAIVFDVTKIGSGGQANDVTIMLKVKIEP